MKFRRRPRSNLADIQAARLAAAANGAYDPKFEVDSDIPAARSLGAIAGAVFRSVALGLGCRDRRLACWIGRRRTGSRRRLVPRFKAQCLKSICVRSK
jgi:hypothetical protein